MTIGNDDQVGLSIDDQSPETGEHLRRNITIIKTGFSDEPAVRAIIYFEVS